MILFSAPSLLAALARLGAGGIVRLLWSAILPQHLDRLSLDPGVCWTRYLAFGLPLATVKPSSTPSGVPPTA